MGNFDEDDMIIHKSLLNFKNESSSDEVQRILFENEFPYQYLANETIIESNDSFNHNSILMLI